MGHSSSRCCTLAGMLCEFMVSYPLEGSIGIKVESVVVVCGSLFLDRVLSEILGFSGVSIN
jgi:hypothetical protein